MKNPFFSIIIATLNSEKTIRKCLESVLNQSFNDWEIVLIDGNSNDSTMRIVKNYGRHIAFYISEKDHGIYDAMNKGVKNSSGEFIYFLNSDDEFYDKDVLNDVYNFINQKKYKPDLITGNVIKVYSSFSVLKNNRLSEFNLKRGIMPPHQSMFVSTKTFREINGFKIKYKSSGDFELCCNLNKNGGNFFYFNRTISKFFSGGISSNKKIAYPETYQIIKDYFGNYYAVVFFLKKIILEQNIKKILKSLNLDKLITFFTKVTMSTNKE